jgi:HSP20 family molecular chaperone IbpA
MQKEESITVAEWAPSVDITEDDKEYIIKTELPEVKKEDVKDGCDGAEIVTECARQPA